ncbi:Trp biosynthesis-associated membrane protein [Arthrobacter sp. NPDC092385]|uniref:Trp biosynthesis-associated membrane protein n=1 Tax=Arthrobacter sp. NPDC092385 TaxID=3363943 RepID=UPI0038203AFE
MSTTGRPAPGRFTRRGIVVMGIVVLALLAFGSTTQTWLTVRLPQEAVQTPDLRVPGSDAATPVTAFALVALAAALAVSIAGRVARWVIAGILVLSGIGIALSSASVALDPAAAAEPAIGAAIGVSGLAGADATASAMPWLAVAAGALLVLAAAWVVLAGRTWGVNRRYDAGASRGARSEPGSLQPGAPAPSTGDVAPGVVPEGDGDPVRPDASDRVPGGATATGPTGATATGPTGAGGAGSGDTGSGDASSAGAPSAGAPSDGTGHSVGSDEPDTAGPGRSRSRASAHADEIDSWDQLSRGNDPTR